MIIPTSIEPTKITAWVLPETRLTIPGPGHNPVIPPTKAKKQGSNYESLIKIFSSW